ncbi:MAG: glycosyltransferase family 39 protein [Candidatus Eisenbacteria bacterium]
MKYRNTVVFLFFAAFFVVGLTIFDDYGISWDETVQRDYGEMVHKYVAGQDDELLSHHRRHYGPVYQMLLLSVERVMGLEDTRSIYLMRHLVTFIVFWTGVVFFYLLCSRLFGSWKTGLLASALLVLSPRIFAHGFYNPKDIPFMSVFIISMYTLVTYLDRRTFGAIAVHALVSAILIDIRIVGGLVPAVTVGFLVHSAFADRRTGRTARRTILSLGMYAILATGLTILLWPTLWKAPVAGFLEAYRQMAHYPWPGSVLYLGTEMPARDLPWHYLPVWIAVSTPVCLMALLACGIVFSVRCLARGQAVCVMTRRNTMLVLMSFLLPVGYLLASRATLYDSWRQAFFVYPGLLMTSLTGLVSLFRYLRQRLAGTPCHLIVSIVTLLIAVDLGYAAFFMVKHHPYQHLYFNGLVGGIRGAEGRFELDYWGLSYRAGLEHILEHDEHERIKVYVAGDVGLDNIQMLRADDRKRLVLVDKPVEANYYLTNFRWQDKKQAAGDEFYSVEVGGVKVLTIYRVRHTY